MKTYQFKIKLLPHLKKFVQKHLLDGQVQPYKIEGHTFLGGAIRMIASDKRSPPSAITTSKHLRHTITVMLSQDMTNRIPRNCKLEKINGHIALLFKECLITWVMASRTLDIPVSEAIRSFQDQFELRENEYKYATAYKVWLRRCVVQRPKKSFQPN